MVFPNQTITIQDPGIPTARDANVIGLLLCVGEQGSTTAIETITSPQEALEFLGTSEGAREAAYLVRVGGAPLRVLRLAEDVAPAAGSVTSAATATLTVDDASLNGRYGVRVLCTKSGSLGTAEVRYALDYWDGGADAGAVPETYSDPIVVPASGEITFAGTGMTGTFDDALVEDEDWTFETTAAMYSASEITGASSLIQAYGQSYDWIIAGGSEATAALADADADALSGVITDLQGIEKRRAAILSASRDTAANVASSDLVTAFESRWVSAIYGESQVSASLLLPGLSTVRIPSHIQVAARILSGLISTDPIRVASGPLPLTQAITHDEYIERNLDSLKIGTLRTWPGGIRGYYVTNAWLRSPANSDFRYTQFATIANRVCEVVIAAQARYVGASLRAAADGTLSEADAEAIRADVQGALDANFVTPSNAEGTPGHVSSIVYQVNRTNNFLSDETVNTNVAIQPLGYPRVFNFEVGFRATAS